MSDRRMKKNLKHPLTITSFVMAVLSFATMCVYAKLVSPCYVIPFQLISGIAFGYVIIDVVFLFVTVLNKSINFIERMLFSGLAFILMTASGAVMLYYEPLDKECQQSNRVIGTGALLVVNAFMHGVDCILTYKSDTIDEEALRSPRCPSTYPNAQH